MRCQSLIPEILHFICLLNIKWNVKYGFRLNVNLDYQHMMLFKIIKLDEIIQKMSGGKTKPNSRTRTWHSHMFSGWDMRKHQELKLRKSAID